jgi:hypothetical protein
MKAQKFLVGIRPANHRQQEQITYAKENWQTQT